MLIERKLVQTIRNKKGNISFDQLVEYFKMHKPPVQDGLFTATDFADECMRVTEGVNEDVPEEIDPLSTPVIEREYINDNEKPNLLLLKNGKRL